MCNAIPILSPFFLISSLFLFFNWKNFYFLVSLLFLCMHAYIKSSGFIGGKGLRPLKKFTFCQTIVMLDYVCVQSFMITHTQSFMLIAVYKVIYVVIA